MSAWICSSLVCFKKRYSGLCEQQPQMNPQQSIQTGDLKALERHVGLIRTGVLQLGGDLLQFEAARPKRQKAVEQFLRERPVIRSSVSSPTPM